MRFRDFALVEDAFDAMAAHLGKDKKGPGRWPVKDPEKQSGEVVKGLKGSIHKADQNYTGKGYSPKDDHSRRGVTQDPTLSLPDAGKHGGTYSNRIR
jgi:hypothetical protein